MGAREETKARQWAWLAGVFLVALAVRLYGLGDLPLGFNEETTFRAVSLGWRELVANRLASAHSPFYYVFLKAAGLTGAPFLWPRLPSAIFDAGAATLFAAIGLRIACLRGMVAFGFLYIAAPILMNSGQVVRPHALLNLFSVWLLLAAVWFVSYPRVLGGSLFRPDLSRRLRRFRIVAFVSVFTASAGALYTLVGSLLVGAAIDIPVAATLIAARQWGALRHWFLFRVLALIAAAPLAAAMYGGVSSRAGHYWVGPADLDRWRTFLGQVFFMWKDSFEKFGGEGQLRAVLVVSLCAMAITGIVALVRKKQPRVLALFVGAAMIPVLLLAIISMHTPLVVERYAMFSTIGFAALAATGLAFASRGGLWSKLAAAFVTIVVAGNLAQFMWLDRRPDFRPAAEIIRLRDGPDVNLYAYDRSTMAVTRYFLGEKRSSRVPKLDDLVPELKPGNVAWLFDFRKGRGLRRVFDQAEEAGLNKDTLRVETFRLDGYRLHRIEMIP